MSREMLTAKGIIPRREALNDRGLRRADLSVVQKEATAVEDVLKDGDSENTANHDLTNEIARLEVSQRHDRLISRKNSDELVKEQEWVSNAKDHLTTTICYPQSDLRVARRPIQRLT